MSKKSGSFFDMQFVTSSISTMLVLLLLGLVVFLVLTANNLSVYVRENIAFSVVLSDDMREADILALQKQLNKEPYVKQTNYISKDQALKEQTEAMGTDPAEFLGYNPFSASIEIKLNADYANSDSIHLIEQELMGLCTDQQYHPSDCILQAFPDSYHEAGWSQPFIYPEAISGP